MRITLFTMLFCVCLCVTANAQNWVEFPKQWVYTYPGAETHHIFSECDELKGKKGVCKEYTNESKPYCENCIKIRESQKDSNKPKTESERAGVIPADIRKMSDLEKMEEIKKLRVEVSNVRKEMEKMKVIIANQRAAIIRLNKR